MTTTTDDDGSVLGPNEERLLAASTANLLDTVGSAEIPKALEDLGWFELWTDDARAAAHALFGQQGRLARTSPMLTLLMGQAVSRHLTGDAQSGTTRPLLLPTRPGRAAEPTTMLVQLDALTGGHTAFAFTRIDGAAAVVELPVDGLAPSPIQGIDPDLALARVDTPQATRDATVVADHDTAARIIADTVALGRRLLAEELTAIAVRQLEMTVEHAVTRTQFGRQIGSYQAVKHKLADVHVATAVSVLAARRAWAEPDEPGLSLMAKVLAGDAVDLANRHCQQVLAGIGFTWEHPFHRYLRRGLLLDGLLGSARQLVGDLGADLLASMSLPPTFAL